MINYHIPSLLLLQNQLFFNGLLFYDNLSLICVSAICLSEYLSPVHYLFNYHLNLSIIYISLFDSSIILFFLYISLFTENQDFTLAVQCSVPEAKVHNFFCLCVTVFSTLRSMTFPILPVCLSAE